jgi:hypothetical protein
MNMIRRMKQLLDEEKARGIREDPSEWSGELARQLVVDGEDELSEKALPTTRDPAVARRRQPTQLGLDAAAALVGSEQGVRDAERVVRAAHARLCYKPG